MEELKVHNGNYSEAVSETPIRLINSATSGEQLVTENILDMQLIDSDNNVLSMEVIERVKQTVFQLLNYSALFSSWLRVFSLIGHFQQINTQDCVEIPTKEWSLSFTKVLYVISKDASDGKATLILSPPPRTCFGSEYIVVSVNTIARKGLNEFWWKFVGV